MGPGHSEVVNIATVFLVDDEKFIVDLYRDILEANGHTVVGCR